MISIRESVTNLLAESGKTPKSLENELRKILDESQVDTVRSDIVEKVNSLFELCTENTAQDLLEEIKLANQELHDSIEKGKKTLVGFTDVLLEHKYAESITDIVALLEQIVATKNSLMELLENETHQVKKLRKE